MKKRMITLLLSISTICLVFVGQAAGSSIGFGGLWTMSDENDGGWAENLGIETSLMLLSLSPDDGWYGDTLSIAIGDMTLDESSEPVTDEDGTTTFYFSNSVNFSVSNGTSLITATFTPEKLEVDNSIGNSALSSNLTDFQATNYTYGESDIIDGFLDYGGAIRFALGFGSVDSILAMVNGEDVTGAFMADTTPNPEPATMLLTGMGLLGLVGYGRRRYRKNRSGKED